MIKLFSAKDKYRDSVVRLWSEAFGDTEEYIAFFLDNCPSYESVGYFDDDKLVSMFFMLEGQISGYKCKYLYAACTDLKYRKQGIMEKLLTFAAEHYRSMGYDGIFLVPANEKLYSYYLKFGYISAFTKLSFRFDECSHINAENNNNYDLEELTDVKNNILENIEGFRFDKKTIEYTIKEHLYNNGGIFFADDDFGKTIIFYYTADNKLIIKEYLNSDGKINLEYCKQILNNNHHNVYILCPLVYNKKDIVEEYTKCGMCLPLNDDFGAYINNTGYLYAGMYLD